MWLFLTATTPYFGKLVQERDIHPPYVLGSYYYMSEYRNQRWMLEYKDTEPCEAFLLDSGAYTFEVKGRDDVDMQAYMERYADFVAEHGIERYLELDVDELLGVPAVQALRDDLEARVGRECVPVWHRGRGKEAFIELCEAYDFVAIGGLRRQITREEFDALPWFTQKAHEHGTHVHGLGHRPTSSLEHYGFDSLDCSSWLGTLSNAYYRFDGRDMQRDTYPADADVDYKAIEEHNLREWVRYVRHVEGATPAQ